MASSNYTTNLGLCSWAESDRPKRADFVADNGIIDSVLGGHVADTDIHLTAAEKEQALAPYASFMYAGDGQATRTVYLGFRPKFVIVYRRDTAPVGNSSGVAVVNTGFCGYGIGGTAGVSVASTGVTVTQHASASDGKRVCLNESGAQYTVIAFK